MSLLDCASSALFISERLTQSLCLPHSSQNIRISGVAGLSHGSPLQSIANFFISAMRPSGKKVDVTAIVVPCVTCDLPTHPVPFDVNWKHLNGLQLADPTFGHFQANHSRDQSGRFIVPLPRKPDAKHLGESRSQAVR